jgi:SAM-dependent methyltransferase
LGEIFERVVPETPLVWTGERLTSATAGQVEIEHLHRYFLARALCRGLDVLDIASGEGYGSALLAQTARSVVGVDLSSEAVSYAGKAYRSPNLRFVEGDARTLPLNDASVDAVVSFETIEHFYEHERFLAEVRRVLRSGGRFIVSSPERDVYSPSGSYANPYHVRELSREEFSALLRTAFADVRLLGQRPILGSALVSNGHAPGGLLTFEKRGPRHFEAAEGLPRPVYVVAVASDQPVNDVPDSLYIDTAEIGAVLAAANFTGTHTEELPPARASLGSTAQQPLEAEAHVTVPEMDAESVRMAIEAARAEAVAACRQRDVARIAARRAGARVAEAERSAAQWQQKYYDLRGRLERLLRRFGVIQASRLVPASGRRFVRERLLGFRRQ